MDWKTFALSLIVCVIAACSRSSGEAATYTGMQPTAPPSEVTPSAHPAPPTAANIAQHFPQPTDELISQTAALARRTWRSDANITQLQYKWFPVDAKPRYYWVEVTASSPRDGARRFYDVGDFYGGTVMDAPADNSPLSRAAASRDAFTETRVDLRKALEALWNFGFHSPIDAMHLQMGGATGTRPLLAWRTIAPNHPGFPITISAETGGILSWRRVYDMPYWSDERIREVMQKLLNRNRPPVIPDNDMGCIPGIGASTGGCSPD